jgi:hypothetical protein
MDSPSRRGVYGQGGLSRRRFTPKLSRADGDVLTMDSRRSQTEGDGTLVQMQDSRRTIVYRRVRQP